MKINDAADEGVAGAVGGDFVDEAEEGLAGGDGVLGVELLADVACVSSGLLCGGDEDGGGGLLFEFEQLGGELVFFFFQCG